MFNVQTHTAPAFAAANKACVSANKVNLNLTAAMTVAVAAVIAADHGASSKTASSQVALSVPFSKEAGNPASTRKTWAVSYFKDSANCAAIRRAIPNVEALSPEDFTDAVVSFCKGIDVRKSYDDARKAAKAASDATETLKADSTARAPDTEAEPEEAPMADADYVPGAVILAKDIIANLMALGAFEALAEIGGELTAAMALLAEPAPMVANG